MGHAKTHTFHSVSCKFGSLPQNGTSFIFHQPSAILFNADIGCDCLFLFLNLTPEFCPRKCMCKYPSIDCYGKNLSAVPAVLPANYSQIVLNTNRIMRLTKKNFAQCFRVETIDLQHNLLENIPEDAFADCKQFK